MWRVTVVSEDGSSRELTLSKGRIRIGRHAENDVALEDLFASRRHAELVLEDGRWVLHDCGSKGGTFLEDERITGPTPIEFGDEVRAGRSRIFVGPAVDPTERSDETVVFVDAGPSESTIRTHRVEDSFSGGLARIMVDAARAIGAPSEEGEVVRALLDLALAATGAERGAIATFSPGGELVVLTSRGEWTAGQVRISRSVLSRVRDAGEAVIAEDIPSDELLRDAGTIVSSGVRSVLCTPLGAATPPRGVLYLDSLHARAVFEPSHFEVVTTLAGMVDVAIENEAAREALRERERTEEELRTAKTIMQQLVPPQAPRAPEGFENAGFHSSCLTIGGDFFDFFPHPGGYGMVLADVAGKGLSAALLVANFHAVWHHLHASEIAVERWLGTLNDELAAYLPDNRFITLALAICLPGRDELVFASAGHNPGLIIRGGRVEQLAPTGPVLGLMPGMDYRATRVDFPAGSRIVLNSDGVTDQPDPLGEEFGQARLDAIATAGAALPAPELQERIIAGVREHADTAAQVDDITLSILGRLR